MNSEEFLSHYGVKGMRWGVRKSKAQRQASARKKGMGVRKLKSENQRVKEAGGGLRGTQKVRKEMLSTGELSRSQYRKGTVKFGANIAAGILGGAAAGLTVAQLMKG